MKGTSILSATSLGTQVRATNTEWLDFPRAGNNDSYHYARRQFNLADDPLLRYKFLNTFDADMMALNDRFPWLHGHQYVSLSHEGDKVVVAERGELLFLWNFHPTKSFTGYKVGTKWGTTHKIVLDSDCAKYGGHSRNDPNVEFKPSKNGWNDREFSVLLYLPCRSCIVFSHE